MIKTVLTRPEDVNLILTQHVFDQLVTVGVSVVEIDEGVGPKNVAFVAIRDSGHIMVAMEGSGCIMLDATTVVNQYKFIIGGFQIKAAQILTTIFEGLVQSRATLEEHVSRAYPQLNDMRN